MGISQAFLLIVSVASPAKADDPKARDLAMFQGPWVGVRMVAQGNERPISRVHDILIEGDVLKTISTEDKSNVSTYTLSIDPSKSPATIDMKKSKDGRISLAIYRFEGNLLTICHAGPGAARPKDFSSTPGNGQVLFVYRHPDH